MSDKKLIKVTAKSAAEVCKRFELSDEVKSLLEQNATPEGFLRALLEKQLYQDAVRFLAFALPKREATWWACLCARAALGDKPRPETVNALALAEKWVYEPTEDTRRAAMAAAETAKFDAPSAWAAAAAFWSTGSIAPPETPMIMAPDDQTGKAVIGAVLLAAVSTGPEKINDLCRSFLSQGLDIAQGGAGRVNA